MEVDVGEETWRGDIWPRREDVKEDFVLEGVAF
jgi:hypothetical protein